MSAQISQLFDGVCCSLGSANSTAILSSLGWSYSPRREKSTSIAREGMGRRWVSWNIYRVVSDLSISGFDEDGANDLNHTLVDSTKWIGTAG